MKKLLIIASLAMAVLCGACGKEDGDLVGKGTELMGKQFSFDKDGVPKLSDDDAITNDVFDKYVLGNTFSEGVGYAVEDDGTLGTEPSTMFNGYVRHKISFGTDSLIDVHNESTIEAKYSDRKADYYAEDGTLEMRIILADDNGYTAFLFIGVSSEYRETLGDYVTKKHYIYVKFEKQAK